MIITYVFLPGVRLINQNQIRTSKAPQSLFTAMHVSYLLHIIIINNNILITHTHQKKTFRISQNSKSLYLLVFFVRTKNKSWFVCLLKVFNIIIVRLSQQIIVKLFLLLSFIRSKRAEKYLPLFSLSVLTIIFKFFFYCKFI